MRARSIARQLHQTDRLTRGMSER